MPSVTYDAVVERKARSITEFIVEAIDEKLAKDREDDLAKGFALLGDSELDEDYPIWAELQSHAMKHIDD